MALVHNWIAYGTSYLKGLRDAVGIGAEEGGVERLGETLTPVVDLWQQPEWAKLRGDQLCATSLLQAAVAAEFSMVALLNAVGSGQLVVVERVGLDVGADMTCFLEMATSAQALAELAISGPGAVRDRRRSTSFFSTTRVLTGSAALNSLNAGAFVIDRTPSGADRTFRIAPPIVLGPGDAVNIVGGTVNTTLVGIFAWRERPILPGELTTAR